MHYGSGSRVTERGRGVWKTEYVLSGKTECGGWVGEIVNIHPSPGDYSGEPLSFRRLSV